MQVYALVGPSGTGKSHQAPVVAFHENIPLIIDDGLLIKNNRILAGRSAKREATRLGAIKRAIMTDPEHAEDIISKIRELKADKLLILGTSKRMTCVIAEKLMLPPPEKYLMLEDIVPAEDIKKALDIRQRENRHVVPIPTFAIKKEFPGYLISPLRSFFSRPKDARNNREDDEGEQFYAVERSIVRPVYSSLGNFFIAEHVIYDMVKHILDAWPGIYQVKKVKINKSTGGNVLNIEITVALEPYLKDSLNKAQKKVKTTMEYLTGFYFYRINLNATKINLQ